MQRAIWKEENGEREREKEEGREKEREKEKGWDDEDEDGRRQRSDSVRGGRAGRIELIRLRDEKDES